MPYLDRNGVRIYYEVEGKGRPLLLTHGFAATSQMWARQRAAFSERFTLIVWDMRGHGRSDYPLDQAEYSEAATVADMAALLDAADAPSAIIGGLSLGGYMSLAFHLAFPERTDALLIVDTGPGYKNDDAREEWNKRALETADRFEANGFAQDFNSSAERQASEHRDASGLVRSGRGMLTQKDARVISSLPNISVPSLVVVGAKDTPFLNAADYMAAKIPGARKVVIANAGHAANIDEPEAFNEAVLNFLDEAVA
jgi:pimeloyl-ACP methyl ester carboxylesterase